MKYPTILSAGFGALAILALFAAFSEASTRALAPRRSISLDGTWQIEQGGMDEAPRAFTHTLVVPGLVDMAQPAFEEVGKRSQRRSAFWYRRTFAIEGPVPAVAVLKIHKAKYGTKVFLNGQVVGEHLPCFTPALLDVKDHLKGDREENELIVRVGADRECLPEGMPTGWDFEKYLYLPGIYDSVELILTGTPHLVNVQTVPDLAGGAVRVIAEVASGGRSGEVVLKAEVTEAKSGDSAGSATATARVDADAPATVEFTVPIKNCRPWSPEDPFLYQLDLTTRADAVRVRFGMRTFRFDPETKRAILNGKPYVMRGTNVCIYRFFEDSLRADRPWRAEWVRRLHRRFKSMHWNSIRYCIGFPPELWYDVADEEGFLIQDEFPIWLLGKAPENLVAEKIIPEYTEWMRERWNHPCVVIWDAQNESVTDQTGEAIRAVRRLDRSGRPWENGWAEPQSPTDCVESHPYLFIRGWSQGEPFRFRDMAGVSGVPALRNPQKKLDVPVLINEYGWLWLNRDGTPTTLTKKIYAGFFGRWSSTSQRRLRYARYLAALTEFWRCHRECAGVLHFCGLGYSRSGLLDRPEGGATSDHFLDLERLVFEPCFEQYVRESFHPVGLMLDFWADELPAGETRQLKVFVINDLDEDWQGSVRLAVLHEGEPVTDQVEPCTVPALGREILTFALSAPREPGEYTLVAERTGTSGERVRSLRDFRVK
jgi:hypothetical protein